MSLTADPKTSILVSLVPYYEMEIVLGSITYHGKLNEAKYKMVSIHFKHSNH